MWLNVTQVSFAVRRKGLALQEVRFLVLFVPVDSETLCPLHSVNSLACVCNCPTSNTAIRHWTVGISEQYVKTDPIGKYPPKKQFALECPKHTIQVILQGRKGVYIQVHTQIPTNTRGGRKTCWEDWNLMVSVYALTCTFPASFSY